MAVCHARLHPSLGSLHHHRRMHAGPGALGRRHRSSATVCGIKIMSRRSEAWSAPKSVASVSAKQQWIGSTPLASTTSTASRKRHRHHY